MQNYKRNSCTNVALLHNIYYLAITKKIDLSTIIIMNKTIVIVDDFKNTLWVIEFTLAGLKKTSMLKAANGKEALNYFEVRTIDLLITDYNMPEMDGFELIQAVRKIPQYEFIPIIILTTEVDPNKKQKAENIKVTAWVQKPFKHEIFLKIVKKCLK